MAIAYYGARISPHMTRTPEGYLICHDVPINRTGDQGYTARDLQLGGDPDRLVIVHRYPEDVFDPAALASFEGKDITQGHPPENLTPENQAAYSKGHIENVRRVGDNCQLVASDLSNPNSRYVINVNSPVNLPDGTQLTAQQATWWAGGAQAGAMYNQSLTYAQYPGAVSTVMWTADEYANQIEAGNFVLFAEDGVVKVMQDINTLTTYTQDIGKIYRYNRTMRLCNTIANDIFKQFSASFIGQVNNNEQGRVRFQAAIVGYLQQIQDNQGIQNFTPEDVEVLPGTAIDAIVVNVAIQAVGSVEKIYMTVEVS